MTQNPNFQRVGGARHPGARPPLQDPDTLAARRPLYAAVRELAGAALHDAEDLEGSDLIGHVEQVVVDVDCSRIAYALLPWGGFMGLGERLLALPWRALELRGSPQRLLLAGGRSQLDGAPSLAPGTPLPPPHDDWHLLVHRHFGVEPYWR